VSFQVLLEKIVSLDIALFHFINDTLYVRVLAEATYFMARDQLILLFLIIAGGGYFFWVGWRKTLTVTIWGTTAVILSNLLHNHLLKLFFNRPRPFMTLSDVHLCVPLNDLSNVSLSFPSTHAASAAALAMVVGNLDSRLRVPAWIFALFIGWGTIYSGGHYPADVIAGYAIGGLLGWGLLRVGQMIWPGVERKQL